tara:strand:- start:1873 stop:2571 length:699 start_codon:yes stop_codon:yes gene_type:complete
MLTSIKNNLLFLKKYFSKHRKNIFYNKFISNDYGDSRGTPITRFYIQHFFLNLDHFDWGNCLEFEDNRYINHFGNNVTKNNTFKLSNEFSKQDNFIYGDLTKSSVLPQEKFDLIVCTNVLNFIFDVESAMKGIHKMLKKNGKCIVTVDGPSSHISRYDMERWGDFWRFTNLSAKKLFEQSNFKIEKSTIYGNPYACSAQLNGFSIQDIDQSKLFPSEEDYQLLIALLVTKKG